MKTTHPAAVLSGFLLLCLTNPGTATGETLKVGDPFPILTQFQLDGPLPSPLKGKVVLVDFWASWCPPCKASFPVMADLHKRYASRGLVIIAVSVDENKSAVERFLKKNPTPFSVVRDSTQKLAATVDAQTLPASFLLDADGRVRFLHNGFKEDTGKQYEKEIEMLLKLAPQ